MIPEIGHFALIMALVIALLQSSLPLIGSINGNVTWMQVAHPAARAQFVFVLIAFVALTSAFINNDFSVAYTANNSNSALPVQYRIAAVWGAHEGSLLLWGLILASWTVAVSYFSRSLPLSFIARVLAVMGTVSVGFLLFMLFTSNPFERLDPAPFDGADLNPLLQDPGLIIHPPLLYMGYVGFSVAFGFAIAALLGKDVDISWARWTRPWTTMAWVFLTIGIALGSWWAYYELGWGGWWFWDPVENASFMPWLIGTALIHSLAATEKRGIFKNWTVLLAISAFALSLLGTFLVRSGVLTSVHAFATDPSRGLFILIMLCIYVGGSLLLYAWRAPSTPRGGQFRLFSRETFLLCNSLLLVVAMASVLLGTIYPLFIEAMGGKISVGAPYFNAVFIPLMSPLFILMGFGIMTRWKGDEWPRVWAHIRNGLMASIVLGVLAALMLSGMEGVKVGFAVVLAAWIFVSTFLAIWQRVKTSSSLLTGISKLPKAFIGMSIAHLGLAVSIMGIAVSSNYSTELHKRMGPGDSVQLKDYEFFMESIQQVAGPNYTATEAVIKVSEGDKSIATLRTQKRIYTVRNMPMTEAGIDAGFTRDIYASLGEPIGEGDWSVRLYHKPFIRWIWLGAIFMAVGGVLAATDRRYSKRVPATEKKAGDLGNLSPAHD